MLKNKNPVIERSCPAGKEINPVTGRCVNKCKDNQVRNITTGKCESKLKKSSARASPGPGPSQSSAAANSRTCPAGKEINPVTGRCVNKCKDNQVRNITTGKCESKIKSTSQRSRTHAKSPAKSNSPANSPANSPPKSSPRGSPGSPPGLPALSPIREYSSDLYYPDLEDPKFTKKIANNMEFSIHKIPDFPVIRSIDDFNKVANKLCGSFETSLYQHFVSQYISYRTPYRSIMLYHGVGVGKTCSAITLSEALLTPHNTNDEPMIWVIMPQSLKQSFKSQIFDIDTHTFKSVTNQCTGDNYVKLLNIYETSFNNKAKLNIEIKKIIKKRYRVFTYDGFAKYMAENYSTRSVENKVIIIDEAHNVRSTNKKEKDSYVALIKCLEEGVNNRLVLLSATPMYNEPRDILDLFKLMLINDKRDDVLRKNMKTFNNAKLKIDAGVISLIKRLSSNYISYLKGKNPFTFALKLNPANSGIKVLEQAPIRDPSNKPIIASELNWLSNMNDGIVTSKLGAVQKVMVDKLGYKAIKDDVNELSDIEDASEAAGAAGAADAEADDDKQQNHNMKLLQPMNIVYDTDIGSNGFYTFFTKTTEKDPINVRYNKNYVNTLYPDEANLGKYSGKFLNICNYIRKSKGVVVIYSRFLLSGILPFAICLEHLGYTREGANNILANPDIVPDKPVYEGVKTPKYCILTSDKKEIMGATTIDNLIKKINKPENINGGLIKVILITPVASEGLSFYNAREIHLIEPWYHFNRPDQIIGRGIRNCRHQTLPFEERNVTVFIHASVDDDSTRETIDIHALRISTRKYVDSVKIDRVIANNALDCGLMKNINYFPKGIFQMGEVNINTSQGAVYKYDFGDNEENKITCDGTLDNIDKSGYRSEVYKHLLKRTQNSIKNLLSENYVKSNIYYVELDELARELAIDNDLLMYTIKKSIYPYMLLQGYYIVLHNNGIRIISNKKGFANKLSIVFNTNPKTNGVSASVKRIVRDDASDGPQGPDAADALVAAAAAIAKIIKDININYDSADETTISIYLSLNLENFTKLVKYILSSDKKIADKALLFIIECLYKQGVLIKKKEIPSYSKNDNEYIGYVNIFDIENKEHDIAKLDINLHIKGTDTYNLGVTKRERDEFAKSRIKKASIPADMTLEKIPWGIIEPHKLKENIINKFKIFSIDQVIGKGKKTGRVCDTFQDKEHKDFMKQIDSINPDIKMKNKKLYCSHIANKLHNINRLVLLPYYKPKS
jgi:hypothetical protein